MFEGDHGGTSISMYPFIVTNDLRAVVVVSGERSLPDGGKAELERQNLCHPGGEAEADEAGHCQDGAGQPELLCFSNPRLDVAPQRHHLEVRTGRLEETGPAE